MNMLSTHRRIDRLFFTLIIIKSTDTKFRGRKKNFKQTAKPIESQTLSSAICATVKVFRISISPQRARIFYFIFVRVIMFMVISTKAQIYNTSFVQRIAYENRITLTQKSHAPRNILCTQSTGKMQLLFQPNKKHRTIKTNSTNKNANKKRKTGTKQNSKRTNSACAPFRNAQHSPVHFININVISICVPFQRK